MYLTHRQTYRIFTFTILLHIGPLIKKFIRENIGFELKVDFEFLVEMFVLVKGF